MLLCDALPQAAHITAVLTSTAHAPRAYLPFAPVRPSPLATLRRRRVTDVTATMPRAPRGTGRCDQNDLPSRSLVHPARGSDPGAIVRTVAARNHGHLVILWRPRSRVLGIAGDPRARPATSQRPPGDFRGAPNDSRAASDRSGCSRSDPAGRSHACGTARWRGHSSLRETRARPASGPPRLPA